MPSLCHLESSHGHRPTASLLIPSSTCPPLSFVKQDDQSLKNPPSASCPDAGVGHTSPAVSPAPQAPALHRPRARTPGRRRRHNGPRRPVREAVASLRARTTLGTTTASPSFAPPGPDDSPWAWTISIAAPAPPLNDGEDEISQVPGRPLRTCPALRPRRTPDPRPLQGRRCGLPHFKQRRLRICPFRGSITRPARSLCTLRSRGRPRTTQHSIPAGGQP